MPHVPRLPAGAAPYGRPVTDPLRGRPARALAMALLLTLLSAPLATVPAPHLGDALTRVAGGPTGDDLPLCC
ncbi:hypothetical protein [Streptomyces sp. NPDC058701]|uniref:hypothetical protein n=1 Tax=Streptomyces sp. NPDC058701 TaxID=3346608 RepID=UPI0036625968